ncbi:MAG: HD domain-containing protein [Ferruginibacter sp.]|nr:HD domain-containing protein [Cytophagales bacterium]
MNKKKIFNDPVYGFVTLPSELVFDLVEHPYFQRLRRIKQVAMTEYVYPGALHTRFQHALGAMHLMGITLDTLRNKGYEISDRECEAAQIAVLLHDIGHGPFSHTLECCILAGVPHEQMSLLLMQELNRQFGGALDLAIEVFGNRYPRTFFHQLVSSQLDMDRMDYLQRDCFFTGVLEGTIGADRIIKMLEIVDDRLVVQEKGIYSIENFLNARRLMYWQVYLHKTTISAETMLIQVIRRVRELLQAGEKLFSTPALTVFLQQEVTLADFEREARYLPAFALLDDHDLWAGIKLWMDHADPVLSRLSRMLLDRRLFKIILSNQPIGVNTVAELRENLRQQIALDDHARSYFLVEGSTSNAAYVAGGQKINILTKQGQVVDIAEASDLPNIKALSQVVKKYYVCYAKNLPG